MSKAEIAAEPLVYVVIPNWNGISHLPACLASLRRQSYGNFKLLMVDNGSVDGSLECSRDAFPGIEIISNRNNLGFARACNQGLYHAIGNGARYVIFLNSDTECDARFVSELVDTAESDSRIAACAPKILYFHARDVINGIGTEVSLFGYGWDRGNGEKDEGQYDDVCDVFGVSGGAMLVRSDAAQKIGAFDPTYFMYFEDIDLSWRIRSRGYRIVAVPKAVVYHKLSATIKMRQMKLRKEFLLEKNRIRGVLKNFELRNLARIIPSMLYFDLKRMERLLIEEGDLYSIGRGLSLMAAYVWNLIYFPSLLKHRRIAMRGRALRDTEMMKFITPIRGGCEVVIPYYNLITRELFAMLHDPPREITMGLTDASSLGAGWGDLIKLGTDGVQARYTARKAYFYLPGIGPHEGSLFIHFVGAPSASISGSVEVNGFEVGRFEAKPKCERVVRFPVPASIGSAPVLEGCILSHSCWVPNDVYSNGDYRRLGVSVKRVALRRRDN